MLSLSFEKIAKRSTTRKENKGHLQDYDRDLRRLLPSAGRRVLFTATFAKDMALLPRTVKTKQNSDFPLSATTLPLVAKVSSETGGLLCTLKFPNTNSAIAPLTRWSVNRHFPKGSRLSKIFNSDKVKIRYSCTPNMNDIVKAPNKKKGSSRRCGNEQKSQLQPQKNGSMSTGR